MLDLNVTVLTGRMAQTPEVKTTQNGKSITSFDLAVNVPGADRNTQPDFIKILCWEDKAEFAGKYLQKGRKITVKGRLRCPKYTDRDGKTRKDWFVKAEEIYFADSKGASGADEATDAPVAPTFQEVGNDDDLPF